MPNETGNKPLSTERWSSVDEITAHLGVSRDTIYRWIELKGLPAHRIGRLWKFKLSEVDVWVRAGRSNDALPPAKSKRGGGRR